MCFVTETYVYADVRVPSHTHKSSA